MARPCKICKLKGSNPKAYQQLTNQINKNEKRTMAPFLDIFNKEFKLNIIPMNVTRHKTHMEGNVHELPAKDKKQNDGEMRVYSPDGELVFTNIKELLKTMGKRHRLFCESFVNTYNHNATASYQYAFECENYGSAASQASDLLKNLNVILYINYLIEERSKRLKISSSFVLTGLLENYARCMQAVEILDREGIPTGKYIYNAKEANHALDLIGKHIGMWDQKKPENPELFSKIMEKLLGNEINPIMAGLELGKANIGVPEALKIAMQKSDASSLDKPKMYESNNMKDYTDEELVRIAEGEKA